MAAKLCFARPKPGKCVDMVNVLPAAAKPGLPEGWRQPPGHAWLRWPEVRVEAKTARGEKLENGAVMLSAAQSLLAKSFSLRGST